MKKGGYPYESQSRIDSHAQTIALVRHSGFHRQAIEDKFSYMDFLAMILQDEVARRSQKRFVLALRRASFRSQKTLEEFDFTFIPGLNRTLITDLASCRFIEEKVCVLIVGPCGAGKSHIAQALGHAAIRAGRDVLFSTADRMLTQLHAARATNSYEKQLAKLAKIDLLIIDDQGHSGRRFPRRDFRTL